MTMDQEPGADRSPAADIVERDENGAPPSSPARAPSFWVTILAALATAILGSTVIGVFEHVAGSILAPLPSYSESWPWDLVLAATGRMIATHLLLWVPVMVASGLVYWVFARRRSRAAPGPFFLALFVLLAALVVIPADLELANRQGAFLLTVGFVAGLGLTAVVYFVARGLHHQVGRQRFERWFRLAGGLGLIVALVLGAVFMSSPLYDPGAYRVAGSDVPDVSQQRPHVLWIVLDTVRADRLSLYGCEEPTTPLLEEFAEQSVVFDHVVANGIWTLPTHASMFTGLAPRTHGLGHATWRLDDSFRTVADELGESGYATGFFSNNVLVTPRTNLSKGFDTAIVVRDFLDSTRFSLGFVCEKWGLTPPVPWLDLDGGAGLTNELVSRWLEAQSDRPVFVFINYMEAHLPFLVPREYRETFLSEDQVHRSFDLRRRAYGELEGWLNIDALVDGYDQMPPEDREVVKRQYEAALRYLDERVREMIDIFRQRGLLDNTLVVITSDHGEYLDTHGMWSHHFLTYQDVLHVPLLLREPGRTEPRRVETLVQLSDLYPTVLRAVLGADAVKTSPDARDLLAVAAGDGASRIAVSEFSGAEPVMKPRLLAKNDPQTRHRATAQIAAVDSRFKYIRSADGKRELYDLASDPGELENLEYSHWKEVDRLDRHIEWWLRTTSLYKPRQSPAGVGPDRDLKRTLKALGYVGDDD